MKLTHKMKGVFTTLVLFTAASFQSNAQTVVNGFYPKKNDVTVAVSYNNKSYDEFYLAKDLSDNPAGLGKIKSSIYNLFAEYGISDRFSVTLTVPYVKTESEDGALDPVLMDDEISGIQDIGVYLKGKIFEQYFEDSSNFRLGAALGFTFPGSDYDGGGVISIGNTTRDYSTTLIGQYTLPFNLFAEVQGGYSFRSSPDFDIPDAVIFTGKLGYYNKYFYLDAVYGLQNSQDGTNIAGPGFGGPATLPETDIDYSQISFNLYVPFYQDMFGVSGGYTTTIDGRNYNDVSGFSVGLVYTMR